MNKTKTSLYIIILLICAALLFGFVYFSNGLFGVIEAEKVENNLSGNVSELNEKDYAIFWIGDVPEAFSNLNLNIIKVDSIEEANLPFQTYSVSRVNILPDGTEEYVTSLKNGYCPANSFVVICNPNNSETCITNNLTSEDYSLIIRSLKESDAKIYVFGEDEVKSFKESNFLASGDFFSFKMTRDTGNSSGFLDDLEIKDMNSMPFVTAFIDELLSEANK